MTTIRHLYYKREEEAFFYTKNFQNVVDVHYKNEYTNIVFNREHVATIFK